MVLIFDLGATHGRFCLAEAGQLGKVVRVDTDPAAAGLDAWLAAMRSLAGDQRLEAVVGGMAGELEGSDGHLTEAPNLPAWIGLPVRERMQKLFNCPVHIMNDVVMGGLGEAYDGAGTTRGVMAYFTVSTGVNAVRLVGGKVDQTISRYEVGQQLVDEVGGNAAATLESVLGGAATERRVGKEPQDIDDRELWQADEVTLARAVYNTSLYWTPDLVVFGGSMMRDIDVRAVARELGRLPRVLPAPPKLVVASLGDLAGLRGALRWWEQQPK